MANGSPPETGGAARSDEGVCQHTHLSHTLLTDPSGTACHLLASRGYHYLFPQSGPRLERELARHSTTSRSAFEGKETAPPLR